MLRLRGQIIVCIMGLCDATEQHCNHTYYDKEFQVHVKESSRLFYQGFYFTDVDYMLSVDIFSCDMLCWDTSLPLKIFFTFYSDGINPNLNKCVQILMELVYS